MLSKELMRALSIYTHQELMHAQSLCIRNLCVYMLSAYAKNLNDVKT
jgi:hypothetical protein